MYTEPIRPIDVKVGQTVTAIIRSEKPRLVRSAKSHTEPVLQEGNRWPTVVGKKDFGLGVVWLFLSSAPETSIGLGLYDEVLVEVAA